MESSELIEMSDAELHQQVDAAHEELFNLRFQLAIGQLRNYKRISQVRRDIARIKNEQRRRQLLAAERENQEARA